MSESVKFFFFHKMLIFISIKDGKISLFLSKVK